jgi:hypothetical protein
MIDIQAWTALAEKLRRTGHDIFATAKVMVTEKGFADEKVLALTLLARTLSNLKTTLLLLREKQIVEARTITRCCYENLYWVIALAEEGAAFVRKMQHDEMTHRKQPVNSCLTMASRSNPASTNSYAIGCGMPTRLSPTRRSFIRSRSRR